MHRTIGRRTAFVMFGLVVAAVVLASPVFAAAPITRERYTDVESDIEEVCGDAWLVETRRDGLFVLKSGKPGDATPYYFDHYRFETTYTDPDDPTRGFIVHGNGTFKDLHITQVSGTIHQFETIDVGALMTMSSFDGRVVARDRGRVVWSVLIDTQGGSDLEAYELLAAEIVDVRGRHPLIEDDDATFCALALDAIGS